MLILLSNHSANTHVLANWLLNSNSPMQHDQGYTVSLWMLPLGDYSWETMHKMMMKKYSHFAAHFDGHCNAVLPFCAHRLMEEVQVFTKNYWMTPLALGEHLL